MATKSVTLLQFMRTSFVPVKFVCITSWSEGFPDTASAIDAL